MTEYIIPTLFVLVILYRLFGLLIRHLGLDKIGGWTKFVDLG